MSLIQIAVVIMFFLNVLSVIVLHIGVNRWNYLLLLNVLRVQIKQTIKQKVNHLLFFMLICIFY